MQKQHPPNASRSSGERGLGGEALLSEKRPLPPAFSHPQQPFREGARGRGLSQKGRLPRSTSRLPPLLEEFSRLICVGLDLGLEIVYTGELPLGALEVEEIQANLLAVEHQTRV